MTDQTTNLALSLDTLGDFAFKAGYKANMNSIDAAIGEILTGSKTHDFGNLADGAQEITTVTVTGAALGDFVEAVSLSVSLAGGTLTAYVSAADTVSVLLQNESGGALNLASATIRVRVRKA